MNSNIYGKYSGFSGGKKTKAKQTSSVDLNENEYRQRPRSKLVEISRDVPQPTLEEKIKAKEVTNEENSSELPMNKAINTDKKNSRVQVEIWGRNYYLGSREGLSEDKIRRVAEFADSLLTKTSDNNPGLIDSRVAILALLDCAEKFIELEDKYNNMRTDYMYYRSKEEEKLKTNPIEDTPMQDFFDSKEKEVKDTEEIKKPKGKKENEKN